MVHHFIAIGKIDSGRNRYDVFGKSLEYLKKVYHLSRHANIKGNDIRASSRIYAFYLNMKASPSLEIPY
jgi:hypothetical protein